MNLNPSAISALALASAATLAHAADDKAFSMSGGLTAVSIVGEASCACGGAPQQASQTLTGKGMFLEAAYWGKSGLDGLASLASQSVGLSSGSNSAGNRDLRVMKADIGYRLLGIFGLYGGLNAYSTGNQYGDASYSIATLGVGLSSKDLALVVSGGSGRGDRGDGVAYDSVKYLGAQLRYTLDLGGSLGFAMSYHLDRYKGRVNTIDEKVSMGRLHLGMGYRF